jgi:hypothetical protein
MANEQDYDKPMSFQTRKKLAKKFCADCGKNLYMVTDEDGEWLHCPWCWDELVMDE